MKIHAWVLQYSEICRFPLIPSINNQTSEIKDHTSIPASRRAVSLHVYRRMTIHFCVIKNAILFACSHNSRPHKR
jgi:hypothetical protein